MAAVCPCSIRSKDHTSFTRSEEPFIRFYDQRFKESYFLSNFFPHTMHAEIRRQQVDFKCSEAFYHAMRAHESDPKLFEELNGPQSWRFAQELKKTASFREDKLEVMHEVVLKKFSDMKLAPRLISTRQSYLVERTKDTFWGDGLDGRGENHLGRILMEVRKEIGGEYGVVEKPPEYFLFLKRKTKAA